ncbi:MAG TPA: lysine--tRNA ligase [Anaerolineae bacterium]|nr:lysine--tRNA ligase [Anaerolineae bacterium]HOQ97704.1 lysine--tRNA ligase [Anaerolineae bacterium]HPL26852.1 lysine--tRNA ligase [Anaerolineae bacterium]
MADETVESSEQRDVRLAKLERLRASGIDPYPARFKPSHTCAGALAAFEAAEVRGEAVEATIGGRLISVRQMGKSTFAHIADGTGRLQIYLRIDEVGEEAYERFNRDLDLGDFVGARGEMFRTRSGEPTLRVREYTLLAKALRPIPSQWYGLRDVEQRYRQRYLDLLVNPEARRIFEVRTRLVTAVRRLLDERGFLEVETPILQPIYGGAAARPFTTYHNELEQTLYLRIADELYLKRLIVGGLDRVYEIGRDFRNEGVSYKHNPEFTQLEAYQAYADYYDMMELVEQVWSQAAIAVLGEATVERGGHRIDLTPPWRRVTMRDAILEATGVDIEAARDQAGLQAAVAERGLTVAPQPTWGKLVDELFSTFVEPTLIAPTFIIDYPVELSPLAKRKAGAPHLTERFEFFIGGLELGNAFSELNDPLDQRERFAAARRALAAGDEEAHPMDEPFLLALEYGMPPTGGVGFGIDRMTMLFTGQTSIREVVLFPQLRTKDA